MDFLKNNLKNDKIKNITREAYNIIKNPPLKVSFFAERAILTSDAI